MYVNFELLEENGRIWIYQAERAMTTSEISLISNRLKDFINDWESHGNVVKGSFQIIHSRFIIIAAANDVATISGCGIDKSVNFIKSVASQLQLNLIDRNIAYWNGNEVGTASIKDWKTLIERKLVDEQTIIFNPMVETIKDMINNWKIPAQNSWLSKYFLVNA